MSRLDELVQIVARLRGPGGCDWDREQTISSLRPYLLEECHEVLDAIDGVGAEGGAARLRGEVGDLLFVLLLVARAAEEDGLFSAEDAAVAAAHKMVARHPHVFGDEAQRGGGGGGLTAWEAIKSKEKADSGVGRRGALDGVPRSLPALLRAHRQGEKASARGFDWPDSQGVLDKIDEERAELLEALAEAGDLPTASPAARAAVTHEYGDLLLATAELGRHILTPPEDALRQANDRFSARFVLMERYAWEEGQTLESLDLAALDALWERAKAALAIGRAGAS